MLDRVIEIINNRGYEASIHTAVKNGVEKTAISIVNKDSNMSPVIYIDSVNDKTAEEIASYVINVYEKNTKADNFDVEWLKSFENVKEKLDFYIQKIEEPSKVMRPYLDLFVGVKINLVVAETDASIRITRDLFKMWNITEDELFNSAQKDEYTIQTMFEALIGNVPTEAIEEIDFNNDMYVISNKSRFMGATCLLYPELFSPMAKQLQSDLWIIPSSIHECIVVPAGMMCKDELSEMITEVNNTEVEDIERLSNHPYFYDFESNTIR